MDSDLSVHVQPENPEMEAFKLAFDHWNRTTDPAVFPTGETLALYHSVGKHFVPSEVTDRLRTARKHLRGAGMFDDFLQAALDKRDGCYDYASYCALGVLGLPDREADGLSLRQIGAERDRVLLALLGDLVSFEMAASSHHAVPFPLMRPEPELAGKRIRRALSALRPSLRRLGWPMADGPTVDEATAFLEWRKTMVSKETRQRMELSILPVSRVHDEYLFLRILQAFEANFAWMAVLLRGAISRLENDGSGVLKRLELANLFQREAARLFPLLGTMQIAAFQDFRRFTEGASAIQSTGYKTVEALCRQPDKERLGSIAYSAVPEVRAEVEAGQGTLEEAFARARREARIDAQLCGKIERELHVFSEQILRWRQAHFQLAKRFLGDRTGTGYTEGVPYLDAVRSVPVFREIAPKDGMRD